MFVACLYRPFNFSMCLISKCLPFKSISSIGLDACTTWPVYESPCRKTPFIHSEKTPSEFMKHFENRNEDLEWLIPGIQKRLYINRIVITMRCRYVIVVIGHDQLCEFQHLRTVIIISGIVLN